MNPSGEAGSCHAAPDNATYAGFRKESRMKFADATKLDRESGVARGGTCGFCDLRCFPLFLDDAANF
jgi:hypothetical protein